MNLLDVRRLATSTGIVAAAVLVWLFFLALQRAGIVESETAADALRFLDLAGWLWISYLVLFLMILGLAAVFWMLSEAPPGFAAGFLRQVQCQDCKAVFVILDTGKRPLTHQCPNCKALGVYDGQAPPVGAPPTPTRPKTVIDLELVCQSCDHHFHVTDTGARPLHVKCPHCSARGKVT